MMKDGRFSKFLCALLLGAVSEAYSIPIGGVEHLGPNEGITDSAYSSPSLYLPLNDGSSVLYFIYDSKLYKSLDGGRHFVKVSKVFAPFAVDQLDGDKLYYADDNVLKFSPDGGFTWYELYRLADNIRAISVRGQKILMGDEDGDIYLSEDGGKSFQKVLDTAGWYDGEDVIWLTDEEAFVYTEGEGLFRSVDGGKTWGKVGTGLPINLDPPKIIVNSKSSNMVVLIDTSYSSTVYISTDGGDTFSSVNLGSYIKDAYIDDTGNLYVATENGLYKSPDKGVTWSGLIPSTNISSVVYDEDTKTLTAGGKGVIKISTDNGITWNEYGIPVSIDFVGFDSTGNLYVAKDDRGIFNLLGDQWSLVHNEDHSFRKFEVALDRIYYIDYWNDMYKCTFTTFSLNCEELILSNQYYEFHDFYLPDPKNSPSEVWVATDDGVYKTTDGGNSWQLIGKPDNFYDVDLVAYDKVNGIIYAYENYKTLYVSFDNGVSWVDTGIKDVNSIQIINGKAFISTDKGLRITTDGKTFSMPVLLGAEAVYKVYADPEDSNHLIARTDNGLYKSTDGGTTWTRLGYFINDLYTFNDLAKYGDKWYAATNTGVIAFKDNNPPTPPQLLFPADGDTVPSTVTLKWQASTDPESDTINYTVFFAKQGDSSFSPLAVFSSITDKIYTS